VALGSADQPLQVLSQSQRLTEQLAEALTSRAVVEQARGILMGRSGGTPEHALERLRTLSLEQQVKLKVVAQQVVDDARRRARARPSQT